MLKLFPLLCAALAMLSSVAPTLAASGTAIGVDPDAQARGKTTRTLVVGADVFIGDRIVTDASGLVQIVFTDTTRLVVGPRSSLVIEDYLLRDNGSAGRFAINALSGTFRFITGDAPKDRYVITTPTGQIGVRGTVFDLYSSKAAAYVMQLRGATINCPKGGGDCELLRDRCEVVELTRGGADNIGKPGAMSGSMRKQAAGWFSLALSQRTLMRPFRVSGAEDCLKPNNKPTESLFDIDLARPRGNDSYQ